MSFVVIQHIVFGNGDQDVYMIPDSRLTDGDRKTLAMMHGEWPRSPDEPGPKKLEAIQEKGRRMEQIDLPAFGVISQICQVYW